MCVVVKMSGRLFRLIYFDVLVWDLMGIRDSENY